ncbi:MAG: 4'-phosphopantetheinyl transferase superfamily protein, partial [Deltaproteobacteria bacterium]|nr:4'-phosphopantetheinyl transferase superfamily protein [Deltaproteobacteria bacterium]
MHDFLLSPDEIHVWRSGLDGSPEKLREYRDLLSEDERARADRLLREADRTHFTFARALLRRLVGAYLQATPASLKFSYASQGRPYLIGNFSRPIPDFNLAHSSGTALFAFAIGREVGVDIEFIREPVDEAAIARRYFHPEEAAALLALPNAERSREFFRLWTRKEAYLKAGGEGVSGMG